MEVNDPVSTVMTKSVIVANKFHNFSEVLELFSKHGMHHLPIVDGNNQLVGIVSSNDIMKIFTNPKYKDLSLNMDAVDKAINIPDIMSTNPITVAPTDTIRDAAKIFADKKFLSVPVVEGKTLVGILTAKDILQLIAYFS